MGHLLLLWRTDIWFFEYWEKFIKFTVPLLKMPLNKLHFIIVERNTHNYLSHFILLPANYSSHSLWNLQHISDLSSLFLFLSFFSFFLPFFSFFLFHFCECGMCTCERKDKLGSLFTDVIGSVLWDRVSCCPGSLQVQ